VAGGSRPETRRAGEEGDGSEMDPVEYTTLQFRTAVAEAGVRGYAHICI
jgi:hypothetical protein